MCGGLALPHANAYQLGPVYGVHVLVPSSAMQAQIYLVGGGGGVFTPGKVAEAEA